VAKIFIFRHGQTQDNKDRVFSGSRQTDLTPEGIEEAKSIGEKLKGENVTKAYQSDLSRSRHTLELVLNGFHQGVEVHTDPRIKERDYGNLTGKSKDLVAKEFPNEYPLWHRSYDTAPPGGESIRDVEKRVLSFINELLPTLKPTDTVLISASGNSIRPMRRYFEHISVEEMCSYENIPGKIYSYQV
jgi:2,3-bisphosphoglycerate-dependent phosphoglycerate mutase